MSLHNPSVTVRQSTGDVQKHRPDPSGRRPSPFVLDTPDDLKKLPVHLEDRLQKQIGELYALHPDYHKVFLRHDRLTAERDPQSGRPSRHYVYTHVQTQQVLEYRFYKTQDQPLRGVVVAIGGPFQSAIILGRGPHRGHGIMTPWRGIHEGFAAHWEDVEKALGSLLSEESTKTSWGDGGPTVGIVPRSTSRDEDMRSEDWGDIEHDAPEKEVKTNSNTRPPSLSTRSALQRSKLDGVYAGKFPTSFATANPVDRTAIAAASTHQTLSHPYTSSRLSYSPTRADRPSSSQSARVGETGLTEPTATMGSNNQDTGHTDHPTYSVPPSTKPQAINLPITTLTAPSQLYSFPAVLEDRLRLQVNRIPTSHPDFNKVMLPQGNHYLHRKKPGKTPYRYEYVHALTSHRLQVKFYPQGRYAGQPRGLLVAIGVPFPRATILGRGPGRPKEAVFTPWLGTRDGFGPMAEDVRKIPVPLSPGDENGADEVEGVHSSTQSIAGDEHVPSDDDQDMTYRPTAERRLAHVAEYKSQVVDTRTQSSEPGSRGLQALNTAQTSQRMAQVAVIVPSTNDTASRTSVRSTPDTPHQNPSALRPTPNRAVATVRSGQKLFRTTPPGFTSDLSLQQQQQPPASRPPTPQTSISRPQTPHFSNIVVSFEAPKNQPPRQRPWSKCLPAARFDAHLSMAGILDDEKDCRLVSVHCVKDGVRPQEIVGEAMYMKGDEGDWEDLVGVVERCVGKRREGEGLVVVVRRAS